jgi:hypothetical protein
MQSLDIFMTIRRFCPEVTMSLISSRQDAALHPDVPPGLRAPSRRWGRVRPSVDRPKLSKGRGVVVGLLVSVLATAGVVAAAPASAAGCYDPGHYCHVSYVQVYDRACPSGQYPTARPTGTTANYATYQGRNGIVMTWLVQVDAYYGSYQTATFGRECRYNYPLNYLASSWGAQAKVYFNPAYATYTAW